MDPVRIERQDGIATVTLDDGDENRVGRDLAEGLREAALKLSDAPPQAVILRGSRCFSAGLALRDDPLYPPFVQLLGNRDAFRAQEFVTRYRNALEGFARLPCLVVAAIEGACIGPGLGLALSADVRIASTDATFGPEDLKGGLVPGFGAISQLASRVGADRIFEAVLTNRRWDATEALSLGLIQEIAPEGTAYETAHKLVVEMLRNPPYARLQALLLLRTLRTDPHNAELESQTAARTWIRGEWKTS
jgi:methylglutaconyl-CoA hydratase